MMPRVEAWFRGGSWAGVADAGAAPPAPPREGNARRDWERGRVVGARGEWLVAREEGSGVRRGCGGVTRRWRVWQVSSARVTGWGVRSRKLPARRRGKLAAGLWMVEAERRVLEAEKRRAMRYEWCGKSGPESVGSAGGLWCFWSESTGPPCQRGAELVGAVVV